MITFFPNEVILLRMFNNYQLHLTSQENHCEAKIWFDQMGIPYREVKDELKLSHYSYLKWNILYLEFNGLESAVLVRMRWT